MTPTTVTLSGADGLKLVADRWGPADGQGVLMLHGAGQTRHSWKSAGRVLGDAGLRVTALDFRGHGDSDWSPAGEYTLDRHRDDVLAVLGHVPDRVAVSAPGPRPAVAARDGRSTRR